MYSFSSFSVETISANTLTENFTIINDCSDECFRMSNEIFHHDPNNEDDGDFEYRFVIRTMDYGQYDSCSPTICIEVLMVPLSKYILDKLTSCGLDTDYDIYSDMYIEDAVREGYYIRFGYYEVDYDIDDEKSFEEAETIANEKVITAACVISLMNSMRGFFLDRYVNRIGTTGWDELNEWVYGKGSAIDATFSRYKN